MNYDFDRADFANNLGLELSASDLTQKELCDKTGITPATMSRYINGIKEPNAVTLRRICLALGISADALLDL